ncbi:hypothetical protein E1262_21215 [Jiangella aurantiaca]|uniref:Uncharacterized protein n=1 Tax=Jiangella aurantiaca TaxID=2530373 RepID=A0A4R5A7B2_9ACTN|nr:hypothetical protein [Jiangella aurantiaca]TDD66699.1 hypothetical protein E1262_21215 [Jiangella aurantiaca]
MMLTQPLTAKIRRVDDNLRTLVERRGHLDDPADVLRATESIDHWLDERLVLMKTRDGESELATTANRRR